MGTLSCVAFAQPADPMMWFGIPEGGCLQLPRALQLFMLAMLTDQMRISSFHKAQLCVEPQSIGDISCGALPASPPLPMPFLTVLLGAAWPEHPLAASFCC